MQGSVHHRAPSAPFPTLISRGGLAVVALLLTAAQTPAQEPEPAPDSVAQADTVVLPDTLLDEERVLAVSLAEAAVAPLRTSSPIYVVDLRLTRRGSADQPRHALVTHYRYDGDLAILTTVDLGAQQAVTQDTVPHMDVPLAEEEVARARELALADPQVRRALGPDLEGLVVEPMIIRAVSPSDPLFGHRLVSLLLASQQGGSAEVSVDLTAEEVWVEEPRR